MNPNEYLILNPAAEATAANFRGWIRRKIDAVDKTKYSADKPAEGLLFVDVKYLSAIGKKRLHKLLDKLLDSNSDWLSGFRVFVPEELLSADQIDEFIEIMISDQSFEEDEDDDGLPTCFLGYLTERAPDQTPFDAQDPDCMVVLAERDVAEDGVSLKKGDWVVAYPTDDGETIYTSFGSMDEAFNHAKSAYGVVRFQSAPEFF